LLQGGLWCHANPPTIPGVECARRPTQCACHALRIILHCVGLTRYVDGCARTAHCGVRPDSSMFTLGHIWAAAGNITQATALYKQ